jgi:hypothetical protein
MAAEMVLIPKVRYERLLAKQNNGVADTSLPPSSEEGSNTSADKVKDSSQNKSTEKSQSASIVKTDNINATRDKSGDTDGDTSGGKTKYNFKHSNKNLNESAKMSMVSILNEMSSTIKDKAERVLKHIDRKGGKYVNWNTRGRLIYENHVVNGSNIVELIQQLFSQKKRKSSPGFKLFHKALVKINVPLSLLKPPVAKANVAKKDALKNKWISY